MQRRKFFSIVALAQLGLSCVYVPLRVRLERERKVCVRALNILEISPEESGGVVAVHF